MITVTTKAAERLTELGIAELRMASQGGGCSGFQYTLLPLNEAPKQDGDKEFESNGIKIIVDPISLSYLKDSEIDFLETAASSGFQIKNPNATSTCGCGQSFNTE